MDGKTKLHEVSLLFRQLDKDEDGQVDEREVMEGMKQLRIPTSKNSVIQFMEAVDTNHDGKISFSEFQNFYFKRLDEVQDAYNYYLRIGKCGKLTSERVQEIVKALSLKASEQETRKIVEAMDHDKDGVITFEEFRNFLMMIPEINPKAVFDGWLATCMIDDAVSEYSAPKDKKFNATSYNTICRLSTGAFGGAVSRTVTAPLDRLKMILQTSSGKGTSLMLTVNSIYMDGGIKAFWRGNGVNVIKIAPETACKFFTFDLYKSIVAQDKSNITMSERFVAGGLAGATAQVSIYPLEIAKTRIALAPRGMYKGTLDCMRQVYIEYRIKGLYTGLAPSVVGVFPYAGVDLAVNSILREVVSDYYVKRNEEPSVFALLSCGMISSSCGMLATYPLNSVRTRMQASGIKGSPRYDGALNCLKTVVQREGFAGLFRGMIPNACKVVPATSISYALSEYLYKALTK